MVAANDDRPAGVVLRNDEALTALQALRTLREMELPLGGGLRVRKVFRALEEHARDIEAERRALAEQYGAHDDEGNLIENADGSVPWRDPKARQQFSADWKTLMAMTWEHTHGIRLSDLPKGVKLGPLVDLGDLLMEDCDPEAREAGEAREEREATVSPRPAPLPARQPRR